MRTAMLVAVIVLAAAGCSRFGASEDVFAEAGVDASLEASARPAVAVDASPDADPGDGGAEAGDAASSYLSEVLADEPMLYYRLGEAAGSTAVNQGTSAAKSGSDGTYSQVLLGSTGALAGDPDTAATFDGTAELTIPNEAMPDFAGTAPFTIEVWAKPTVLTIGFPHLVAKESGGVGGIDREGYALFIEDGAGYALERWSDNSNSSKAVSATFVPDVFSHVVGTFDGSTARLYVNGETAATSNDARPMKAQDVVGRVCAGPGTVHFHGVIDEIAIYGKALGPDRVAAHFRAGSGR